MAVGTGTAFERALANVGFRGRVRLGRGGVGQGQDKLQLVQEATAGGMPQAEVPDLVNASGQDVLEEAADELAGFERHGPPRGVIHLLVTERDLAVFDGEDAAVGDGDTVNVPSQVAQDVIGALDAGFAVDHPVLSPDLGRDLDVRQRLGQAVPEPGPEDRRQGLHGHQVVLSGGPPGTRQWTWGW